MLTISPNFPVLYNSPGSDKTGDLEPTTPGKSPLEAEEAAEKGRSPTHDFMTRSSLHKHKGEMGWAKPQILQVLVVQTVHDPSD